MFLRKYFLVLTFHLSCWNGSVENTPRRVYMREYIVLDEQPNVYAIVLTRFPDIFLLTGLGHNAIPFVSPYIMSCRICRSRGFNLLKISSIYIFPNISCSKDKESFSGKLYSFSLIGINCGTNFLFKRNSLSRKSLILYIPEVIQYFSGSFFPRPSSIIFALSIPRFAPSMKYCEHSFVIRSSVANCPAIFREYEKI